MMKQIFLLKVHQHLSACGTDFNYARSTMIAPYFYYFIYCCLLTDNVKDTRCPKLLEMSSTVEC